MSDVPATVHALERAKPWERLPQEPADAYDAFLDYLKQDPAHRNVEALKREGHKVTWRTKERWKWVERAEAFDSGLAEQKLAGIEARRVEANARQADIGRSMQELAASRLDAFARHGGRISAMEAARIAEIGARLERLALGEPTENVMSTRRSLEGFLLKIEVDKDSREVTD